MITMDLFIFNQNALIVNHEILLCILSIFEA